MLLSAAGARNMAVDHALLESAQQGGPPALRLYRWTPACLSLGRNQTALGIYDAGRAARLGLDVVRRPTGGLGVLHDDELTYSVTAPVSVLGGARPAYQRINEALLAALQVMGVRAAAAAAPAAGGMHPKAAAASPCFQVPAEGEVVAAGRKLVGSAQRCERRGLLQHGSVLRSGSQDRVLELLAGARVRGADDRPAPAPAGSASISLAEALGSAPDWNVIQDAVTRGFRDVFGICLAPTSLSPQERERVGQLELLYADAAWTWRL